MRLPGDKRDLVNLVDRISAALNDGRTIEFELDETQVNRWVAARDQLWVEGTFELPPQIHDPQIRFRAPGVVLIAAQIDWGYFRPVAQMEFALQLDSGEVVARYTGLRIGGLQLPVSVFASAVSAAVYTNKLPHATLQGNAFRAVNEFTWRNGNRRCRLTKLTVSDGVLQAGLEPLPRKR